MRVLPQVWKRADSARRGIFAGKKRRVCVLFPTKICGLAHNKSVSFDSSLESRESPVLASICCLPEMFVSQSNRQRSFKKSSRSGNILPISEAHFQ